MGRSRSRSPQSRRVEGYRRRSRSRSPRERERYRERDLREPERERERERRRRPRSRSPRKRSLSPQHRSDDHRRRNSDDQVEPYEVIDVDDPELEGKSPEEIEMMRVMGFTGFDTSKGKPVKGNDKNHGASIVLKRRFRQYMNRRGGFNRPLDFIA